MGAARPAEGPEPGVAVPWPYRSPCPPLEGDGEAAKRGRGRQQHATSRMPLASSMTHTGSVLKDAQGRGQEGREPPTKPRCLRQWRRGRRSRRTGTPSTPGGGLLAKALSLWKYGGQRGVGAQRTQRTRKRSTRIFSRGGRRNGITHGCTPVDAAAMETEASWEPHGDGPQVLSRMRCKPPVRFSTGGMRKRAAMQRALSLPNPAIPSA